MKTLVRQTEKGICWKQILILKKNTCSRGPDFQPVNLHDKVIFQEEEANDGEEINQDEC